MTEISDSPSTPEILPVSKKDVEYLASLKEKLAQKGTLFSILTSEDKKLYTKTVETLKNDTGNELTQIEYDNLTALVLFCEKFEKYFYGIDPSMYDVDLFEVYRKAKNDITEALRDHRKESSKVPQSIEGIQKALLEIEKDDGTKIKRVFEKKKTIIIEEPLLIVEEEVKK